MKDYYEAELKKRDERIKRLEAEKEALLNTSLKQAKENSELKERLNRKL